MAAARYLLVALVVMAAVAAPCQAALALCAQGAAPAVPGPARILSNVNKGTKAEVTIAFDNPTNEKTGCPTSYTISLYDSSNQALGAKASLSNPIQSPITKTFYLSTGQKYVVRSVSLETADKKKSTNNKELIIIPAYAQATTGRKML